MKMYLAAGALGAALVCGPAWAQDEPFTAGFGNTITVTFSDGGVARYYFEPEGAFSAVAPDGGEFSGAWVVEGEQICFDIPEQERACAPFIAGKQVGDTWQQPGTTGETVTVSIVAGREAD